MPKDSRLVFRKREEENTMKICVLHTTATLVPILREVFQSHFSAAELIHLVDEAVLFELLTTGEITPWITERLSGHVASAEHVGAKAVLLTCSSVSPTVDSIRPNVEIPVVKIDEAMIEKAVLGWSHIGVVATAYTTVKPTEELIRSQAQRLGKKVKVTVALKREALQLFYEGDLPAHDRLVLETAESLPEDVDGVVLAQVSLARLVPNFTRPVLSSPELAVERVRKLLLP